MITDALCAGSDLHSAHISPHKPRSVSSFFEWTTHSEPKGEALWSTVCYRSLRQNRPFLLTLFERMRHSLRYAEGLDEGMLEVLLDSKPVRRLTIFGIALPLGVIIVSRELERRNWAAPDLIAWMTIVAGFWWIAGMFVTGVYLIRDAIGRHD